MLVGFGGGDKAPNVDTHTTTEHYAAACPASVKPSQTDRNVLVLHLWYLPTQLCEKIHRVNHPFHELVLQGALSADDENCASSFCNGALLILSFALAVIQKSVAHTLMLISAQRANPINPTSKCAAKNHVSKQALTTCWFCRVFPT